MGEKKCSIFFLVLLLSTAASAQAQDGPWDRLRGRISSFLSNTADALDRDLATRQALRNATARSNTTTTTGNTGTKTASVLGGVTPAQPAQGSRRAPKATRPAARLQQAQCQARGQVTAVWCREDASGALQDVAYLNSASGLSTSGCSGQGPDGSSPYSKGLFLGEEESIISVRACSDERDGYTSLTFITDAQQTFTCGTSSSRRNNAQALSSNHDNNSNDGTVTNELELQEEEEEEEEAAEDGSRQWRLVQAAAAGLNDTLLLHTSDGGEPLRLQFVDHIQADKETGSAADSAADIAADSAADSKSQLQDVDSRSSSSSSNSEQEEEEEESPKASSRRAARAYRRARRGARSHHHEHHAHAHRQQQGRRGQAYPTQARLPSHLKKYFTQPSKSETTTTTTTTVARSGRSSTARTLLGQQPLQAVTADSTPGSNDSAAATAPATAAPAAAARTSAAAEPSTWWWFDWGHNGNNQPGSNCQLLTPDRFPIWASAQASTQGTGAAAAAPSSVNTTKAFTRGGSGAESYLAYGNKRYYRNAATYAQQLAAAAASQSKSTSQQQQGQDQGQGKVQSVSEAAVTPLGFEPAFFFDEVHPLAGLALQCGSNGLASKVDSLCWDSGRSPQPTPWGVDDVVSLSFESFTPSGGPLTCPRTPSQVVALSRDLEAFGRQLAGSSGGVVGGVTWQQYTPDMCAEASMDRNTTITLGATFAPAPGRLLLGVAGWLLRGTPRDLCDMSSNGLSVCEGTGIDSASHSIGFGVGEQAQQQRLANIQRLQDSLAAEQARGAAALQQVQQQPGVKPVQLPQAA